MKKAKEERRQPRFTFAFFLLPSLVGQGRNRTADAGLFRAALYQLSYLAIFHVKLERARSIRRAIEGVNSTMDNLIFVELVTKKR